MSDFVYEAGDGVAEPYDDSSEEPLTFADETGPAVNDAAGDDLASLLRAEFGRKTVPTVTLPIPGRSGWELKFRTDWTEGDTRAWSARAKDKSSPSGVNQTRLFRATIADQCVDVLKDGRSILPGNLPRPFHAPAFQNALGVKTPTGAVEKLLPVFAQLQSIAADLTAAAGSGDLLDPTDPLSDDEDA